MFFWVFQRIRLLIPARLQLACKESLLVARILMKERFLQTTASRIQIWRVSQQEFSMYRLKLPACPRNLRGISPSLHQCDPCTKTRIGLSLAPRNLGWNIVGSRNETARLATSGKLLGYGRQERAGVCTRAYREEDWAKLFQPEALKKEDLKQYLNDDPIWLWVFKSWQRSVNFYLRSVDEFFRKECQMTVSLSLQWYQGRSPIPLDTTRADEGHRMAISQEHCKSVPRFLEV